MGLGWVHIIGMGFAVLIILLQTSSDVDNIEYAGSQWIQRLRFFFCCAGRSLFFTEKERKSRKERKKTCK